MTQHNTRLSLILLVFFLAVVSVSGVMAACPDGMTAYWNFSEETPPYADSVSAISAACSGTCPDAVSDGRAGNGILLDGSATGLSVPADDAFSWDNDTSFSIEFWFRRPFEAISGKEVIVGRKDPASQLEWYAGLNESSQIFFYLSDRAGRRAELNGTSSLNNGAWHHVVIIRDAPVNQLRLYVDGEAAASVSTDYTQGFVSNSAAMTIGFLSFDASLGRFKGRLDELALYSRSMSGAEIQGHYNGGLADIWPDYCAENFEIKIMALGDSLTKGLSGSISSENQMVSYRQKLWTLLGERGTSVNFVGGESFGGTAFDSDNEAHEGWQAGQIADNVFSWLTVNPADIVLLHAGTTATETLPVSDVERILSEIDRADSNITVLLALIIKRSEANTEVTQAQVEQYNALLEEMALKRIANGDKIILVDMENALIYPDDISSDTIHPTQAGYEKMAAVWLEALRNFNSFESPLPVITSSPMTEISFGQVFTYDLNAYSPETITYGFVDTPPDGMSIDAATGLIEWNPQSPQTVDISVYAENTGGRAVQEFSVSVINLPPVAQVQSESLFVTEGDIVSLNGSASYDPDGGIASYKWEQISGEPQATLQGANTTTAQFTAPAPESLSGFLFRLTVTDRVGLSDSADVQVSINNAAPPLADAGEDQTVSPGTLVRLDASKSTGRITSYQWEQINIGTEPVVTLSNPDSQLAAFTTPAFGLDSHTFLFRLTVKNEDTGLSDSDEVQVTVLFENVPLIADAGPDQVVDAGAVVRLDGSNSEGNITAYQWTQINTGDNPVTINSADRATASFIAPETGEDQMLLQFRLTVLDENLDMQDTDNISVNVSFENISPVADAGEDQTASEGTTITLDGSGSYKPGGGTISYQWVQKNGVPVTLASPESAKTNFVIPAINAGSLSFELTVTDEKGLSAKDEIVIFSQDNGITDIPEDIISQASVPGPNIGISVDSGGALTALYTEPESEVSQTINRPQNLNYGLIRTEIKTGQNNSSATISMYLPEPAPSGYFWYEYSAAKGWQSLEEQTVFNGNRTQATITLSNNSSFDSSNGFLRSLIGPGSMGSTDGGEDQLSAYWRFEEGEQPFYDNINNLDANCSGDCPTSISDGRVGNALLFDGLNAGLSVSPNSAFNWENGDNFTIEFYFKRSFSAMSGTEIIIGRNDAENALRWYVGLNEDGKAVFFLRDRDGLQAEISGTKDLNDGFWHHLAALRDVENGEIQLYVDGELAVSAPAVYSGGFASQNASLDIGFLSDGTPGHFKGTLDEVALHRNLLSPREIQAHYYNGLADFRWAYTEPAQPIRIMPLGNSITKGSTPLCSG